MVRRNRWFVLCPWTGLSNFVNAKNCSTAVADKHFALLIERQSSRDSQVAGEHRHFFEWRHPIDCAIVAAGDEHLTSGIEGDRGWIHDVTRELFDFAISADAIDRDFDMLATRAGTGYEQRVVSRIEHRIGNRMNVGS